jgi:hypothetical protein
VSLPADTETVRVELAELIDERDRLRGVRPWNAQMAEKIGWALAACERHIARLKGLLA